MKPRWNTRHNDIDGGTCFNGIISFEVLIVPRVSTRQTASGCLRGIQINNGATKRRSEVEESLLLFLLIFDVICRGICV